ncbi:MAG: FHA domain-containing protein [Kiritimatiellae bacterium]|nr:FHA domain-containing protein [Kiritimatiellia bacterium]
MSSLFAKRILLVRLESETRVAFETTTDQMSAPITIGRGADCVWSVGENDRSVSLVHAELFLKRGTVWIRDMGSRNGIYLVGEKVSLRKLSPGDIYRFGEWKLVVEKPRQVRVAPEKYHRLEQLSGEMKGKIYDLKEDKVKIGASSANDIVISDSLVSQNHAVLEVTDGSCVIKDLKSRNGTKVNSQALTEDNLRDGRMLRDGDIISIAYVDFRFWDRNVTHVRSHLLLKMALIGATIGFCLGGYFMFQSISPSARDFRIRAEQSAAQGNFADAESLLAQAKDARAADDDAIVRNALLLKLKMWKDTYSAWFSVKDLLGKGGIDNFFKANTLFSRLIYANNDNWKWSQTSASKDMYEANAAHEVLSSMLALRARLAASEEDLVYLASLSDALKKAVEKTKGQKIAFLSKLMSYAEDVQGEAARTLLESQTMDREFKGFSAPADADKVLARLQSIKTMSEARIAEREKEGLVVSRCILRQLENAMRPVADLGRAYKRLVGNGKAVASMNFKLYRADIGLPSVDDCKMFPQCVERRAEMLSLNEGLGRLLQQLKGFESAFKDYGITADGKEGMLAPLFDRSVMESALSCDAFGNKPPAYTDKIPQSKYDSYFGVNVFFLYLSSLEGDFDASILEERFKPSLFQAQEIFGFLETYRQFISEKLNRRLSASIRFVSGMKGDNKFLAYASCAKTLLEKRDALMRERYKVYLADRESRKGILSGGIVSVLSTPESTFLPATFKVDLFSDFRSLRKRMGAIAKPDGLMTPEKQISIHLKLLEAGIPGDAYLREAWAEKFR